MCRDQHSDPCTFNMGFELGGVDMSKDTKDTLIGAGMILFLLITSGLLNHFVDGL